MTIREKLKRLHNIGSVVLFRWSSGKLRLAKDYVILSNLRMEVLTCTKEDIIYSTAAPCLVMDHGKPTVHFSDRNILTISDGKRHGMNVLPGMLFDGESATEARFCKSVLVDETHCPKWLERRILSIGLSPVYPVPHILIPEIFRISKNINTLKPYINKDLLTVLGCDQNTTVEKIIQLFHENIDMFSYETDEGYIVSNEYIASGGCCVALAKGLASGSSVVFQMPLKQFQMEAYVKNWHVSTTKEMLL